MYMPLSNYWGGGGEGDGYSGNFGAKKGKCKLENVRHIQTIFFSVVVGTMCILSTSYII